MANRGISRRKFIKGAVASTAALAVYPNLACSGDKNPYDAKGLPTRILGRTGVTVPLIGIGTGSRFCAVKDEDKALEILTYALDHGLYYWDTAHDYINKDEDIVSEVRLGKLLKHCRKEVFLSTKVQTRDPNEAKRHIEESLSRLQTDHVDILQIHNIRSVEDVESLGRQDGVYSIVNAMREQGVAKYIGFTGHTSDEAMAKAAKDYDFDSMLVALNHYGHGDQKFEEKAVPQAAQKDMGVMVIKVIRPRETVSTVTPKELISYALSLKHVHVAMIGTDSLAVLKDNIALLKAFKPYDKAKMEELRVTLEPFYRNKRLELSMAFLF